MNSFIETLNHWGGQFLNLAWPMLWQSSLLIAIVFVLDLALRRKIRAAIRYALWLVVLVKLLLPPSLALPTSVTWWLLPSPQPSAKPQTTEFVVNYGDQSAFTVPLQSQPAPAPIRPKMSAAAWALAASGVASAGLLAWLLVRWRQINHKVRRAKTSEKLIPVLDEARRLTRLRPGIRLKLTDDSMSPAVCGLFRPVILLPQSLVEKLSAGQLRAVLLHEAIHLRRGDVWVNCAQAMLQILYWWHPLLWLANARIRRAREEAVDDAVMLALRDEAEIYAPTLLEVAKLAFNRPLASLGLVGILESRNALRQRIERLVNFDAPRKAGLTIVSILGILAFSAVALPMGQAPEQTNNPVLAKADENAGQTNTNTSATTNSTTDFETKSKTANLVQDGKLLYEMGKFDEAGAKLKAAIALNPDNQAANYYLDLVKQARRAPKSIGPKLIYPGLDSNPTNLSNGTDNDQSQVTKAFRINQPMKEDDLKKLLLDAGVKIPPTVCIYQDNGILLVRTSEEQMDLVFRVVLKLNGISPTEIENIVNHFGRQRVIIPDANPAVTNLEMRVFKVDPNTFAAGLRGVQGLQTNNAATMAESLFSKLGVDLTAPGRSMAFQDRLGLLFVKATPSELDTIERIIQVLNQVPPEIHIKARFMEVPESDVESVLKAGVAVDTKGTNKVEIITATNETIQLRKLESHSGFENLAEPEAVTISGRQTQMRATEIVTVLTNINPLALRSPGVSSNELFLTERVECGPVFDVVPYVLDDGYTINLKAIASVIEFLGYAEPTNSVTAYVDGQKRTVPVPLPKFRVREISTPANLFDGQTLILSGPATSTIQITKDKVPFTGDLPLVGGLFRSQTETSVKKSLIVFVTATIVDPAGNRVHSDDELPFNPSTIPVQAPVDHFTPSP
jgi:beta-lactamase regulating signal transducer with metallopeptidase domain/type II secretory pathway component GspD/PulD (secretin)